MAGEFELEFALQAGEHSRRWCPVHVPLEKNDGLEDLRLCEVGEDGKVRGAVPCQAYFCPAREKPVLCFILDGLDAGQERRYGVKREKTPQPKEIHLEKGKGVVKFWVGDTLLTAYHYENVPARPYLYPVTGPWGILLTQTDAPHHVHHRSLYVAHGDVNGTDNWSEEEGHGRTDHKGFRGLVEEGSVAAVMGSHSWWVTAKGEKILEEELTVTTYALPETGRILDLDVRLIATEGDVVFGDTKEGGLISVRMNPVLEVPNGGRIENSYGGINEGETWGKRAQWCDYSGTAEGRHVGIAIFDCPGNLRHPTYWHVRNYGLMTSNNFGVSAFTGDPNQRGDYTLPKGQTMWLRYRVYLHVGDATEGNVKEKYHDFANPPKKIMGGQ